MADEQMMVSLLLLLMCSAGVRQFYSKLKVCVITCLSLGLSTMASHHGFVNTVFGLGASHRLIVQAQEKVCLAWPIASSPRPNHEDHYDIDDRKIVVQTFGCLSIASRATSV